MVGWHHQLDGHELEQAPGLVMDRKALLAAVHDIVNSLIRLRTELNTLRTNTNKSNCNKLVTRCL